MTRDLAPFETVVPQTINDLFAAQVSRAPDAIAVRAPSGQELSYADLYAHARRVASALAAGGVGADARVGIYLNRDLDLIIAVTGALLAGSAYVPLDVSYPRQRLRYMAADSGASLVLTTSTMDLDFLPEGVGRFNLDDFSPNALETGATLSPIHGSNLAYVIYTSGSTGHPKGVAMPHAPLVNLLRWQNARSALDRGARTLQFSPIGFDVSFQEIFSTLTSGGVLVLIDEVTRRDPVTFTQYVSNRRIERLFLPFVALQQLALWSHRHAFELPWLREVNTAGEALRSTPAIVDFFARHSRCVLDNQYGPTETHVVTAHRLTGAPHHWPARPPIGRPLPSVETHVLDEEQQPVTQGDGELYIGGVALARGYLGRPDLNEGRFIILPHVSSQRLYRTGDLVRRQNNGNLEFIGRRDQQVKIRGHRIELTEVEAVLGSHPDIAGCAVYVSDFGELDQRLVAAVVLTPGRGLAAHELRAFLRAQLPDYMVPSLLIEIDRLPLTASGKVDRSRMPKATPMPGRNASTPRDETERRLVEIWSELLQMSGVGISDDFFDSGGDSLLAVRLFLEIEQRFGRRLPISTLIHANTVERLAALVRSEELPAPSALVTVNDRGDGIPFFWVHGLTGGVAEFLQLGRALGPNVRAFAFETPLDGGLPPYAGSIERTAAHHVVALTNFYPSGPFFLGGWSAGATVALEMAGQLEALGRRPLALVAFDGAPFNSGAERSRLSPIYWLKLMANVPSWLADDLAQTSARDFGGRVVRKVLSFVRRTTAGQNTAAIHDAEIEGFLDISRAASHQQEFMRRQYHALREYVPQRYQGRVILYRAKTHPLVKLHEYERIWRELGAELDTVMVAGTHLQVVTPTPQIVNHLRARLDALSAQVTVEATTMSLDHAHVV
jgi:amino acid adenylation domain-containing protein